MPAVLSTSGKVLTTSTSMEEVMSVTGTTNMKSNEVYEGGLFSFFFSFQIWYLRIWIFTSIGQGKHMRVTRFSPLWVSDSTRQLFDNKLIDYQQNWSKFETAYHGWWRIYNRFYTTDYRLMICWRVWLIVAGRGSKVAVAGPMSRSWVQSRGRGSNVAAGENDLGFEVTEWKPLTWKKYKGKKIVFMHDTLR